MYPSATLEEADPARLWRAGIPYIGMALDKTESPGETLAKTDEDPKPNRIPGRSLPEAGVDPGSVSLNPRNRPKVYRRVVPGIRIVAQIRDICLWLIPG